MLMIFLSSLRRYLVLCLENFIFSHREGREGKAQRKIFTSLEPSCLTAQSSTAEWRRSRSAFLEWAVKAQRTPRVTYFPFTRLCNTESFSSKSSLPHVRLFI